MHDENHKEGDLYTYICDRCGFDRGVLDHPSLSAVCPDCKIPYRVEKIEWSVYGEDEKLKVGDILCGYCCGKFGRDSYGEKRVEVIGADYVVVREFDGSANFASCNPSELCEHKKNRYFVDVEVKDD